MILSRIVCHVCVLGEAAFYRFNRGWNFWLTQKRLFDTEGGVRVFGSQEAVSIFPRMHAPLFLKDDIWTRCFGLLSDFIATELQLPVC
jgi:hypothetical protein